MFFTIVPDRFSFFHFIINSHQPEAFISNILAKVSSLGEKKTRNFNKQMTLYLFNNFFLYVYIKRNFPRETIQFPSFN